jgi:hypothetical protein
LIDAFLAVELFQKVYEEFKGTILPQQAGLRNLLQTQFGVVKARVAPTVRIMLDSAEQAGLFSVAGTSRMVMPNLGPKALPVPAAPAPQPTTRLEAPPRHGGSGSGGGDEDIHPAFRGLLSSLPGAGERLSIKRRKAITDAFTNIVNIVYPEDENDA